MNNLFFRHSTLEGRGWGGVGYSYRLAIWICGMYQRKADLDMLNAVKMKLADVSSVTATPTQTKTSSHRD